MNIFNAIVAGCVQVRTRFDLAYLWPLPPLSTLDPTRVHLPYTSLPISDVFAVVPRDLAESYFAAALECHNSSLGPSDFQRGAGPTEELLLRHLLGGQDGAHGGAPLQLHDFPIAIARPSPDSKCQVRGGRSHRS